MEFVVSEPLCDVIIMYAAVAHVITWSYGDLPRSSGCQCWNYYLNFFGFKASVCLVEDRFLCE